MHKFFFLIESSIVPILKSTNHLLFQLVNALLHIENFSSDALEMFKAISVDLLEFLHPLEIT